MTTASIHQQILELLQSATGTAVTKVALSAVGGGSINDTYKIVTNTGTNYFCKINNATKFPSLFAHEQQGLELLARQQVIRTPQVIGHSDNGEYQLLILEWIEQGLKTANFWKLFGEQLAALHNISNTTFGLDTHNYMGALPQYNQPAHNWVDFFIQQRLEPQIKLAGEKGLLQAKHVQQFERLYIKLPQLFPGEPPALLHGDLWSGNYLCDEHSRPVLIDPAVYYGHRSMDLGMTTLFGGFDKLFYDSYQQQYAFPPGYRAQWDVCNLYPLLIHLNLFGSGYLADILQILLYY